MGWKKTRRRGQARGLGVSEASRRGLPGITIEIAREERPSLQCPHWSNHMEAIDGSHGELSKFGGSRSVFEIGVHNSAFFSAFYFFNKMV